MKLLSIVGARPQFVKAAAVSRAIAAQPDITELMVHTGQHFDHNMSGVFFDELGIAPPAINLGIAGGSHGAMTGRMLEALDTLMAKERPDWVVVYGDTNSTLAGALAAAKLCLPLAHVEAGLRSFNRRMPEEINRVLTDHVSNLLLCPTETAVENLGNEGVRNGVHHVGDVMYDATLDAIGRARAVSTVVHDLGLSSGGYVLATIHRAENTDSAEALSAVAAYLREGAAAGPVVMPLHPRTRAALDRFGLSLDGVTIIQPVGYLDMMSLLDGCREVWTDSGGLQKEAYFLRKPCVTLRGETEWIETIDAGWNRLWRGSVYRDRRDIGSYGDGHAAEKIVALLRGGARPGA